jgi:hypothetical protein
MFNKFFKHQDWHSKLDSKPGKPGGAQAPWGRVSARQGACILEQEATPSVGNCALPVIVRQRSATLLAPASKHMAHVLMSAVC